MSELLVKTWSDVGNFVGSVRSFLVAREAEHNLLLGLCSVIQEHPATYPTKHFYSVEDRGQVVLASLQTPPHIQIISETESDEAVRALAQHVLARGEDIPGVLGPKRAAQVFAEECCSRRNLESRLGLEQRIYRASKVIAPPATAGACRDAEEADRELLAQWYEAFHDEAAPAGSPKTPGEVAASLWLRRSGRRAYLWEVEGQAVCLAGVTGETPNGIRVGPVYTPPEHRGSGFASSLVATVTQRQLQERKFCFLFTNLANPTSNSIYQAVGYEAVTDVDQLLFEAAAG